MHALTLGFRRFSAALATVGMLACFAAQAKAEPMHGIAMHGQPALPPDFTHFPYADPDAPKGGKLTYAVVGTFDSLNPFIVQGATTTARGIWDTVFGNNVFESLLVRSRDEPFTLYGLLAETVETPDDRSWVEFTMNPKARWSDGEPVTADDVIFTLELLRDKGRPNYRTWYDKITSVEKVGERGVRITFNDEADRELPLLIGLMPVLPQHAIDAETFDKSTLKPMIGSGPYVISEVSAPDHITLTRSPDYWARDLPAKVGFDNYDQIRVDYYRDASTMFEAFKKGLYDIQIEGDPAAWTSQYDFPAVADGRVVKEAFTTGTPKGMAGFAFNTRRPVFASPDVRRALAMLFDFEWVNKNLYFGVYKRTGSFFEGSELSALGRPASAHERELLAPFPDAVAPEVMEGTYAPTVSDGSGSDRRVLKAAADILFGAGYKLDGNRMVAPDGQPLAFEFLSTTRESERLALAYGRTLERLGIQMSVRTVDAAQYQKRVQSFDFDMIQTFYSASLSPGNEQNFRWSQQSADLEGSFNFTGTKSPAADAMISALLTARNREDFVDAVRALDRVLISGWYVVPLFYLPEQWIAYRSRIGHPQANSLYGPQLSTWWVKPGE